MMNVTNIIITGCSGKMGASVINAASGRDDVNIAAGVDIAAPVNADFEYAKDFSALTAEADVIVDFSNPAVLSSMLEYAQAKKKPVVICTTGFSDEQLKMIDEASKNIPIFRSGNMSLGINLIIELAKKASAVLVDGFDIEIIEQHHNLKLDAPSGTALMIADAVKEGIHSVRGGNIVGEHEIIFAGQDEILKISHSARSKTVFAVGALNAAVFLKDKQPGMYNMSDLLSSK